jgi:hypothetical protein
MVRNHLVAIGGLQPGQPEQRRRIGCTGCAVRIVVIGVALGITANDESEVLLEGFRDRYQCCNQ